MIYKHVYNFDFKPDVSSYMFLSLSNKFK